MYVQTKEMCGPSPYMVPLLLPIMPAVRPIRQPSFSGTTSADDSRARIDRTPPRYVDCGHDGPLKAMTGDARDGDDALSSLHHLHYATALLEPLPLWAVLEWKSQLTQVQCIQHLSILLSLRTSPYDAWQCQVPGRLVGRYRRRWSSETETEGAAIPHVVRRIKLPHGKCFSAPYMSTATP